MPTDRPSRRAANQPTGHGATHDAHIRVLRGAIPSAARPAGPPTRERLARFEARYQLTLPGSYRLFVEEFGQLDAASVPYRLLGLVDGRERPTTASVLAELRVTDPDFPPDLVPVEVLPGGQVACIRLDGKQDPPVVVVDRDRGWDNRITAAPSFSAFCFDWVSDVRAVQNLLRHTKTIAREVADGARTADQQARPVDWRAYRFCSQDVFVAGLLLRHNRESFVTEVAALPTATLSAFADHAPARAALTLVLADAFRSGGDLSVQFTTYHQNPRPVRIPGPVVRLARSVGVPLKAAEGRIDARTSRRLFAELVLCSNGLRELLRDGQVPVDTNAVCFAIVNGVWDAVAAEHLVRNAHSPARIFRGASDPLQTPLYTIDLFDCADALLLAALGRRLLAGDAAGATRDTEDVTRKMDTEFTGDGTVLFDTSGPAATGWCRLGSDDADSIEVLPLCADRDTLAARLLRVAAWLAERIDDEGPEPLVLVPRDLEQLDDETREGLFAELDDLGVGVLVAPLYSTTLLADATRRLERIRTSRQ